MKILFVIPSFKMLGGVANHYEGLSPYWKSEIIYCFQGKRPRIPAMFTLLPDYFKFVFLVLIKRPDIVIVNPSLRPYQIKRDSVYITITHLLGIKTMAFIHGWDWAYSEQLINKPKELVSTFNHCSLVYVLYSKFKTRLQEIGIKVPIKLTTTKVSDKLLEGFDISCRKGRITNILFLARLEENKGIFILLDAFKELKERYPDLKLTICGSGTAEEKLLRRIRDEHLSDVVFCGRVRGEEIKNAYITADIYVLPTTHGEGMATTILEAMAFGLPVLSRPVGGINDFFEQKKMGYLTDSLKSQDYVAIIDRWANNPVLVESMSKYNHVYAMQHFLASSVTSRYEKDITNCL